MAEVNLKWDGFVNSSCSEIIGLRKRKEICIWLIRLMEIYLDSNASCSCWDTHSVLIVIFEQEFPN